MKDKVLFKVEKALYNGAMALGRRRKKNIPSNRVFKLIDELRRRIGFVK